MSNQKEQIRIALLGGGPSCLFVLKRLIDSNLPLSITIIEKENEIGAGMPYSDLGANVEHITNVSDNEIPLLKTSIKDWILTIDEKILKQFIVNPDEFTQFHVVPRLLFGNYLRAQFKLLEVDARKAGIDLQKLTNQKVTDITDHPESEEVVVTTNDSEVYRFDKVVICTGHNWPQKKEGKVQGIYDSPYPPLKLRLQLNHRVAIKGSSLTAIDAIRTLARENGSFSWNKEGRLAYKPAKGSTRFKLVMHSRNGLLPAIRFHLEEPQLSHDSLLTDEVIAQNKKQNGGFLSLDFLFDKGYKVKFRRKDPLFYNRIKDQTLEEFVEMMMKMRKGKDPFELFKQEYREAERSIDNRESIYWKEMLAELSYTLNYPAKYLSAEDMLRLKTVLSPLIAIVIAFVPQNSCQELFALHDAGKLEIVSVGSDSIVQPRKSGGITYRYTDDNGKSHSLRYRTYVDCSGQPHLAFEDLPFEGLKTRKSVSQATLRFKSAKAAEQLKKEGNGAVVQNSNGDYLLQVPGITINDNFQIVNEYGIPNERIYMMAVPYIGGYNPDYSGLDFSEEASLCIVEKISELYDGKKSHSALC